LDKGHEEEEDKTHRTKLVNAPAPAPANINSPIPNPPSLGERAKIPSWHLPYTMNKEAFSAAAPRIGADIPY